MALQKKDPHTNLGRFELSLNVKDIGKSWQFYKQLGFERLGGSIASKCITIQFGNCRISLYQGYINNNLLNFTGGDIDGLLARLHGHNIPLKREAAEGDDGSKGALVEDPDGNEIYFVFHPDERL